MLPLPPLTLRAPRVIVVDDQEWILEIAVQVVRNTLPTAEIVARRNGLEALTAFCEGGADFVVSNHYMPLMTGMELIQALREHAPDLPIVMISVHPEAKRDAEAAGANWFLTKRQIMEFMPRLLLSHISSVAGLVVGEPKGLHEFNEGIPSADV